MEGKGFFGLSSANARKSVRTRGRLMDAASRLFADHGFDSVTAAQIAAAAGVATPTFYLYFGDKDEMIVSVASAIKWTIMRQIAHTTKDVTNAAERVSWGTRTLLRLSAVDDSWGRVLARDYWYSPASRLATTDLCRADIELGVRQELFTVAVDDLLMEGFLAVSLAAMSSPLADDGGREAGSRAVEMQLRLLGMTPAAARDFAWRAMPEPLLEYSPDFMVPFEP